MTDHDLLIERAQPAAMQTLLLCLTVTLAVAGCGVSSQPFQTRTLSSGRVVKVLGMGTMHFSGGPPALMLRYQTDLSISDKQHLKEEVDDIWSHLRVDAEQGHFSSAIISAVETPRGFIFKKSQGYNFVYERQTDGTWTSLDDSRKASK